MQIIEAVKATHPFLQNLRPSHLALLLKGAAPAEFETNEVILKEGDYADKLYLIHRGKVSIECHTPEGDIPIETLGADTVLGWSWLFPPFTSHFQAHAVEPTVALQLNAPELLIASEEDDSFGHELMRRVAQLAIHRMQQMRQCLVEACHKTHLELGSLI